MRKAGEVITPKKLHIDLTPEVGCQLVAFNISANKNMLKFSGSK